MSRIEGAPPGACDDGFTLIELVMSLAVLMVGLLALAMVLVSSTRQTITTRESNLLSLSVANAIENVRAVPFEEISTTFGSGGSDRFWCTEDGDLTFADPGNAVVTGDFTIYANEDSIPASFVGMDAGYDLDANATVETGLTVDYLILPIRVRATSTLNGTSTTVVFDYIARDRSAEE